MITGVIRDASRFHGTLTRLSCPPSYAGRAVISSGVMPWCCLGSLRKYKAQASAQNKLTPPTIRNDPRHDTSAISVAISHGVSEFPRREDAWVMPWAKPRLDFAVQKDMARVAVGNVAPSPNPR